MTSILVGRRNRHGRTGRTPGDDGGRDGSVGSPSQAMPRITATSSSSSKEGMEGILRENLQKASILLTPGFLTSGCQNWEKTIWFSAIPFVILYDSSARKQVSTTAPIVPEQLLTAAFSYLKKEKNKKMFRFWE